VLCSWRRPRLQQIKGRCYQRIFASSNLRYGGNYFFAVFRSEIELCLVDFSLNVQRQDEKVELKGGGIAD